MACPLFHRDSILPFDAETELGLMPAVYMAMLA
jgi:hypothetical protein